jgi:AraC family transcriptional regulator
MRPLRTLDVSGFRVCEAVYDAAGVVPTQPHRWAMLCLTIEGGYRVNWGRARLSCGPAALVFHAPGQVHGARISDVGSRCLTVDINPAALVNAADALPDFERLNAARRMPPHWLAFQLRQELELRDDLSSASVASIVIALLAELSERPGLEARSTPPPWLERVREQIDDEFRRHHTLDSLARTAGVHHVSLAREFRRRFGCTVGHYIRQRRVEFACHRLTDSPDPLSEIAFDAGFADQSHFTNTFRQLVGMPPGNFRARFVAHS